MRRKLCFELLNGSFPIRLWQHGKDNFTVEYGKQINASLDYAVACCKLGQAIFHCLACDDKLDNRLKGEE